jgi:hypothetical protein
VNCLSDRDLELLERYLDGDLAAADADDVRRRVATDPMWGGALEGLREERSARMLVWRAMEGSRAEGQRTAEQVITQARRQEMRRRFVRAARGPAVAAACLVFFLAGWFVRGQAVAGSPGSKTMLPVDTGEVGSDGAQVALTDEDGNIVAVQRFPGIDQARQFAEDLTRWRAKHQQAQTGRVVRVADEY